jgi:hypothetical protein
MSNYWNLSPSKRFYAINQNELDTIDSLLIALSITIHKQKGRVSVGDVKRIANDICNITSNVNQRSVKYP